MFKQNYEIYLRKIRNSKESTVKHYVDAINWISKYLNELNQLNGSIFDVKDFEELVRIKEFLQNDIKFQDMNRRGHQMYSAGLNNYFRFANGEGIHIDYLQFEYFDIPQDGNKTIIYQTHLHNRNPINKRQVIEWSDYLCSANNAHYTFTNYYSQKPYMEGHHIIPMKMQNEFKNSLDVYSNIVCLCPTCHRKLHYGTDNERIPLLEKLYMERSKRLNNCGISISKVDFIDIVLNAR